MNYPFSLSALLGKHRQTMAGVVFLSILESLLFVAQFYFIGKAVNDLINDSWNGVYVLIGLFGAKVLVSYFKQMSITKTYKTIYEHLITQAVAEPLENGDEIQEVAPRSVVIHEMTHFFKGDLVKGFETIVRLILTLIALFLMNKIIFLAALVLAVVVFVLYFVQRKNTRKLSQDFASEYVQELHIMEQKKAAPLFEHHKKLENMDNQLLGISALNLSIIEILSFVFMIVSLVVLVKTEGENALGTFFAMLYYVMAFSEVMFLLPSIYQKYIRIQELSKTI